MSDTPTLDLVLTLSDISGNVLDSPLLGGEAKAALRDRATHTGTQTAATIIDLLAWLLARADDTNFDFANQQTFKANGGASVSTGGSVLVTPAVGGTGAGLVVYQSRGADALGRALVVNQDNAANPQQAVRIQNEGTGHTVSISHNPAAGLGAATAEALDIISTNPLDTTVGISGVEEGRGTVKITHTKPTNPDTNASALSLRANGVGTAAQGIFFDAESVGGTLGKLMNFRQQGVEKFVVKADGTVQLPGLIPLVAGGDVVVDFSTAGESFRISPPASVTASFTGLIYEAPDALTIGVGGQFRALAISGLPITMSGAVLGNSFVCFNFNPAIVMDGVATTNLASGAVYQDGAQISLDGGAIAYGSAGAWRSFRAVSNFVARTGTSSATITPVIGFQSAATFGLGWTATDYRHIEVQTPAGAGTITNHVAMYIEDLATFVGSTTVYSIRSLGLNVALRHGGPAKLGADATLVGTDHLAPTLELERTRTITGAVIDGYVGALALDPAYDAATAQTVTRHNYIDVQNVAVTGLGPAAVTNAALLRFDAAVGAHLALANIGGGVAVTIGDGPTGSTAGNPLGWIKINVNGTLRYVPFW